jgi:hypothetical protein
MPPPDLILRGSPNWTAVCFFLCLGLLHLSMWVVALIHGRGEAYMSLIFGVAFVLGAVACWLTTTEIAVLAAERRVRLRLGYRRLRFERSIPFGQVRGVRVTLTRDPDFASGRVELVCDEEAIECPPTPVAPQEALCLAMTMGVRLIKVSDGESEKRMDEIPAN